jgi:hypothetical protein
MAFAQGFVPRLRRPMEALDLGLGLLQAHARPIFAVGGLQVGILLGLILPFTWHQPLWVLLWIWWLKPWLDRGTLFVLSRAVFGQPTGIFDFLGAWREVHGKGLLATLLWRRLSPTRSYLLPVFQLEGLGGATYRARTGVLRRQGGGTAALLTFAGLLFTLLTLVGVLGILQGMLPRGSRLDLWALFNNALPPWFSWALTGLGLLALALTEPFYVAAGFALYLNRRTQLEGWDLELAFRRLAARIGALLLAALLILPLGAQEPTPPPAEETPVREAPLPKEGPLRPEAEARARALKIQAEDPAFARTREEQQLRYRPTGREPRWLRAILDALFGERERKQAKPRDPGSLDFLKVLAGFGKVLLVGGLVTLLVWLLYRFRHRLGVPRVKDAVWEAPEALAGLDIRPESLPPDVPGTARRLFAEGQARAALALLYRGALAELVHRRGLEIPASATEGDCLAAARPRLEPEAGDTFTRLTQTWQRLAYNGEIPEAPAFEALCQAWPTAFRTAGKAAHP